MSILDASEIYLELEGRAGLTDPERAVIASCIKKAQGAITRFLGYDPEQKTHTEYLPRLDVSSSARGSVWEVSSTQAYVRDLANSSTTEMQATHLPIRSITTLKVDYDGRSGTRDGAFGAETEWTEGDDFWPNYDLLDSDGVKVCSDGIIRSQGRWPNVPGSVELVYVSGYTPAELRGEDSVIDASPIWESAIDETIRRVHKSFSRQKRKIQGLGVVGPLSNERLGDYSYSMDGATQASLIGTKADLLYETVQRLQDFANLGSRLGG